MSSSDDEAVELSPVLEAETQPKKKKRDRFIEGPQHSLEDFHRFISEMFANELTPIEFGEIIVSGNTIGHIL